MRRTLSLLSCLAVSLSVTWAASPSSRGKIAQEVGTPYVGEPVEWSGSWSGPYVGLGAGILNGLAALQHDDDFFLNGVGNWGYVGDIQVGYDYRLPNSPFVIGAFGGYSLGGAEVQMEVGGVGAGSSLVPTWNAGVRGGIVSWNNSLLYVGYKYQTAKIEFSGAASLPTETVGGHGVIGGIEYPVSRMVTLGLEYGYTRFDDVVIEDVRIEPEAHIVMLRGKVRFNIGN